MKFRTKLVIILSTIALVPIIVIGTIIFLTVRQEIKQNIFSKLDAVAQIQKNRLEENAISKYEFINLFTAKQQLLVYFNSYINSPSQDLRNKITSNINLELKNSSIIKKIFLVNKKGVVIASTDSELIDTDISSEEYFTKGVIKDDVSTLRKNPSTNEIERYLIGSMDYNEKLLGYAIIVINTDDINSLANDYTGLGDTGETLLVKNDGNDNALFLTPTRFDKNSALIRIITKYQTNIPALHAAQGEEKTFFDKNTRDYKGAPVFASTRYVSFLGWGIVVKIDQSEALAQIYSLQKILILILLLVVIMMFITVTLLSSSITKPIKDLVLATIKISQGDLSQDIVVKSKDEIGVLAQAFNTMKAKLKDSYEGIERKVDERTKDLQKSNLANQNILEDLSIEKSNYESLAKDLEKFKLALDNASDYIVITDPDGIVIYANKGVEKITGYTVGESLGKKSGVLWKKPMPPEYYKNLWDIVKNQKKVFIGQIQNRRKNGAIYTATIAISPILNSKGEVEFFLEVQRDITNELFIEQELVDAKAKDDALLASIGDGVIATNNDGIVILVNHATEKILGYKNDELVGKKLYDIVIIEDENGNNVPREKRPIQIALDTRETITNSTYYYKRKDQTKIPISLTVSPIILNGNVIGAVDVFVDITKEKEAEKLRIDFLSLASHQLRTPLSGMKWLIETMQGKILGKVSKKQKEYLDEIYKINERMIQLVYEMLDVLRLESETGSIKKETVSITDLYNNVANLMSIVANSRKITLINNIKDSKNISIETNLEIIKTVLECFLSNSIYYSKLEQQVYMDFKEDIDSYIFIVKDNGIGIPKSEQKNIFEKFYRATNAKEFKPGGTGLGLATAKMLASRIGGKITFESEENKGTTFYLRINKN